MPMRLGVALKSVAPDPPSLRVREEASLQFLGEMEVAGIHIIEPSLGLEASDLDAIDDLAQEMQGRH